MVPVTFSPVSQKGVFFRCHPRVLSVDFTITGIVWAWQHNTVSGQRLSCVITPFVSAPRCSHIPCNTRHYDHTLRNLAGVWSHSLVFKDTATTSFLVITPPVVWPSLFALDSNRRPVSTPPQNHNPSLSHIQGAGLLFTWCLSPGVR